ncbi:nucleolar protein 16 [Kwoniella sp. CBS 9459]
MANPRQRNKAKSHKSHGPSSNSIRRMHQKLRKAPPLKGPEVLQESWDKKKTVFQNYAALGLLPKIPIPQTASSSRSQRVKLPAVPAEVEEAPKVGFGRIIRDEEGNVIDIVIDEEPEEAQAEAGQDQEGDVPFAHDEAERAPVQGKTDVVRKLEQLASTSEPVMRHSSTSEKTWLQQLVIAYGDDYEQMAKDRKLNVWQKTQGEIKRMIKKAGGVDKLRA